MAQRHAKLITIAIIVKFAQVVPVRVPVDCNCQEEHGLVMNLRSWNLPRWVKIHNAQRTKIVQVCRSVI